MSPPFLAGREYAAQLQPGVLLAQCEYAGQRQTGLRLAQLEDDRWSMIHLRNDRRWMAH